VENTSSLVIALTVLDIDRTSCSNYISKQPQHFVLSVSESECFLLLPVTSVVVAEVFMLQNIFI